MIKQTSLPILGNFEVIKVEDISPSNGQINTSFEKTIISFVKSAVIIETLEENKEVNMYQEIRDIYLQEDTDLKKIHVLFTTEDAIMLLITAGRAILSEIDRPFLMICDDILMTSGILFSLNRISK